MPKTKLLSKKTIDSYINKCIDAANTLHQTKHQNLQERQRYLHNSLELNKCLIEVENLLPKTRKNIEALQNLADYLNLLSHHDREKLIYELLSQKSIKEAIKRLSSQKKIEVVYPDWRKNFVV